jgi:hypothetical protein
MASCIDYRIEVIRGVDIIGITNFFLYALNLLKNINYRRIWTKMD